VEKGKATQEQSYWWEEAGKYKGVVDCRKQRAESVRIV
jgi:hypothetical protein